MTRPKGRALTEDASFGSVSFNLFLQSLDVQYFSRITNGFHKFLIMFFFFACLENGNTHLNGKNVMWSSHAADERRKSNNNVFRLFFLSARNKFFNVKRDAICGDRNKVNPNNSGLVHLPCHITNRRCHRSVEFWWDHCQRVQFMSLCALCGSDEPWKSVRKNNNNTIRCLSLLTLGRQCWILAWESHALPTSLHSGLIRMTTGSQRLNCKYTNYNGRYSHIPGAVPTYTFAFTMISRKYCV